MFISARQRYNSAPLVIHAKRLNKLLRWIQQTPKRLNYGKLKISGESRQAEPADTHLRVISDAAFKREAETGFSLRGAVSARCPGTSTASFTTSAPCHLLEWTSKGQRHVTRSTFSAELLSAGDTLDHGLLMVQQLHEIQTGETTCSQARDARLRGGFSVPMALYIEAYSVFAAITATFVNTPAEKSLLCHVQFIRELLDRRVLRTLVWLDTRDMTADGVTEGTIERDALGKLLDGHIEIQHKSATWTPKIVGNPSPNFLRLPP